MIDFDNLDYSIANKLDAEKDKQWDVVMVLLDLTCPNYAAGDRKPNIDINTLTREKVIDMVKNYRDDVKDVVEELYEETSFAYNYLTNGTEKDYDSVIELLKGTTI